MSWALRTCARSPRPLGLALGRSRSHQVLAAICRALLLGNPGRGENFSSPPGAPGGQWPAGFSASGSPVAAVTLCCGSCKGNKRGLTGWPCQCDPAGEKGQQGDSGTATGGTRIKEGLKGGEKEGKAKSERHKNKQRDSDSFSQNRKRSISGHALLTLPI